MALKVHHLRPAPGAKTAKIRVGRGEAGRRGKTAGRGTKGSGARTIVPQNFEGGQMPLHMRLPKLRGFKNPFRVEYQVVNLDRLGQLFPDGGTVGVADLVAAGAVRSGRTCQDPRQRRRLGRAAGERARLLRISEGEDRRRGWQHYRALTSTLDSRQWRCTDWLVLAARMRSGIGRGRRPSARPGLVASGFRPSCHPHGAIRSKTDRSRATMLIGTSRLAP